MFQSSPNPLTRPLIWAIPLLLLAGALSVRTLGLNLPLFHLINLDLGRILDPALWQAVTITGDGLMAIALLLILHRRNPEMVLSALIAGILAGLCVHLLKYAFELPRPPAVLDAQAINIIGPGYRRDSFPSGHASTLFALVGCLTIWMRPAYLWRLFPLLLSAGAIAAISRSVVGVHWPVDILAGAAIGWLSAIAASALHNRFTPGRAVLHRTGWLLALCTLYLLLVHDTGYTLATPLQHGLALIALSLACLQQINEDASPTEPGRV